MPHTPEEPHPPTCLANCHVTITWPRNIKLEMLHHHSKLSLALHTWRTGHCFQKLVKAAAISILPTTINTRSFECSHSRLKAEGICTSSQCKPAWPKNRGKELQSLQKRTFIGHSLGNGRASLN